MEPGAKIYAYCERHLDPGFWAEPLNAVTNAAFLIAAIAAWMMLRRQSSENRPLAAYGLIALMVAIGIGSSLFHTIATVWAEFADVAPIGLYMLLYFFVAMRNLLRLPAWMAGLLTLGFVGALWMAGGARCDGGACLNGSVGYFPAFGALLIIGGILAVRRHRAAGSLISAGLIFAVSITFRTMDQAVCAETGLIGTHFLWHLLNAIVLTLCTRSVVLANGDKTPAKSSVRPHRGTLKS